MKLQQIKQIAEEIKSVLKPFCKRIKIAGSIRREKPECKDIEIVCIPDKSGVPLVKFLMNQRELGNYIFNKDGKKYKQFLYCGVWVDLFITNENFWGLTYLIRTGAKDFNIKIVNRLKKLGWEMKDGKLSNRGYELPIREEQELFDLLKMKFVEPKNRN